jgi:MFS family permease
VLFFLVLYLLDSYTRAKTGGFEANQTEIFVLLGAALVFITLRNLMYWIPVHTDMAKFTDKSDRGKQLGLLEATSVSLKAFMPLVAGVILSFYSYDVLFLCVIFVCLSSFVPLMVIPRTDEKFEWSYRKTWAEFFSKERRKTVLAYMGDGAENVIGILVWPVFIWEVLNGNYLQVGLLSSLVILVTVLLQLTLGKLVDRRDKKKMLRFGTFFYSVGWIAKMFVVTAFHIFAASAYHNFARIFTRTPFDVLTYEKAADQGHYVDEFTVIHEMAVNLGRVVMLGVVLILVTYLPLEWTFLLGALAALALNFLTPDDVIEEGRHAG